jgi:hypothetical protein
MATKKKNAKRKTNEKAKAKTPPQPNAKARAKTAKSKPKAAPKKVVSKQIPPMALAAADDPTGCCTFTNSAGQIMMRDMRQSQCSKMPNSTFTVGVKCNG